MKSARLAVFFTALSVLFASSVCAAPKVLVSIKPIHSLVAAVMQGVGEPELLLDGAASPHSYALKPSQARHLAQADVIFWMGEGLEVFLEKAVLTIAQKARSVEFLETGTLIKLPYRRFDQEDHDDHAHETHKGPTHNDHDHGVFDTHVWLDPVNAQAMVKEIAVQLASLDPENAAQYEKNAGLVLKQLDALTLEINGLLAPYHEKAFVVFHDAYQYFEKRFHLSVSGVISLSAEHQPGMDHIRSLRAHIKEKAVGCILSEPQFQPKLVAELAKRENLKVGEIDPLGAGLPAGPGLYKDMLRQMARSIVQCLS